MKELVTTEKVAIIMAGNIRTWKLCGPLLKKQILDKYNCDIFCVFDVNNSLQTENLNSTNKTSTDDINAVINFYNPVKYKIVDTPDIDLSYFEGYTLYPGSKMYKTNINNDNFANVNKLDNTFTFDKLYDERNKTELYTNINDRHKFWKGCFRQYTNISSCIQMMKEYSENNNIQYASVIRVRFDQYLFNEYTDNNLIKNPDNSIKYCEENISKINNMTYKKLDIAIPKDDEIYILGGGYYSNLHVYANEQFFITSYKTSLLFLDFNKYIYNKTIKLKDIYLPDLASIEYLFAHFLKDNKLDIKILPPTICGVFVREKYKV